MSHVLIIADKCIKEEVHCKITLIAGRDIRTKICIVVGRQDITLPAGTDLYCN